MFVIVCIIHLYQKHAELKSERRKFFTNGLLYSIIAYIGKELWMAISLLKRVSGRGFRISKCVFIGKQAEAFYIVFAT